MGKFSGILLLSDIDGTIAENGAISEENRKAVEYFKENGGMFAYASGRTAEYIKELPISPNVPVIATTGSSIYDCEKNQMLYEYTMPNSAVDVMKKMIASYPLERWYTFTKTGSLYVEGDVPDDFDRDMYKVVFVFKNEKDAVAARKRFNEECPDFAFERSWSTFLEMRLSSAGKGHCLRILKEITGARVAVAAGNYENDIDMLSAADISYVPSDAIDGAKEVADYIGVSFYEDFIAWLIKDIESREELLCR